MVIKKCSLLIVETAIVFIIIEGVISVFKDATTLVAIPLLFGFIIVLLDNYFSRIMQRFIVFLLANRRLLFKQREFDHIDFDSPEPVRNGFTRLKEIEIERLIDVFHNFKGLGVQRIELEPRNGLFLAGYLDIVRHSLLRGNRQLCATWDNRTLDFLSVFNEASGYLKETVRATRLRIFIDSQQKYQSLKSTTQFQEFISKHHSNAELYFHNDSCLNIPYSCVKSLVDGRERPICRGFERHWEPPAGVHQK